MEKKQILVAGGTGLLGSSLTKILSKKRNYLLTSSYLTGNPDKKLKKNYKRYDFLNYKDCLKATKNKDIASKYFIFPPMRCRDTHIYKLN